MKIFTFFRKQQDLAQTQQAQSTNSNNTTNEAKSTLMVKNIANILGHPVTRLATVALLAICVCAVDSQAQTISQTSADITTTITNLFSQIYDNFRIPISAVALTVAAAKFAGSDANGRRQSYLIGGAIILFWIIPGVIKFFGDVSGTN